jgi:hypothetical protein
MKRARLLIGIFLPAIVLACGCHRDGQAAEVEMPWFLAPPGLPDDGDVKLYKIVGLRGLIDFGDEMLVMVYGPESREAELRNENIAAARSSSERWLPSHPESPSRNPIRVPDIDDDSGARFYYLERDPKRELGFMAVCVGPMKGDRIPRPAMCWRTIQVRDKVVSLQLPEPIMLKNGDIIAAKVLDALEAKGVIKAEYRAPID